MKKLLAVITIFILIFGAWYFFRNRPVPPPVTESENLNKLLRGAPVSIVDLTNITPDTIIVPADDVIRPDIEAAEMLDSFSSTQAIEFSDYLIVMEFLTNNVAAYTRDGTFLQRIGGVEISQAASITANSENLYVYDYGNKVIHTYDSGLSYQESVPFSAPYYTQGSIKINDSHMAFQREEASGFRVSDTGFNDLLAISELERTESPVAELIPRIVPSGKHPGGFNTLLFSMNQRSDIVSAYPALPYLFVYRNFEQHRNIVLLSPSYEEVDNPDLTPFQPVMGEAVRISNLMDQLYLADNGDIMLFSMGKLHHIRISRSGNYQHSKSYVILQGDSGQPVNAISSIDASSVVPGIFYVVSSGNVLRLNLPG